MRTPDEVPTCPCASLLSLMFGLFMTVNAGACAHFAAKNATTGALESLSEKSVAETGERPAELIAGRAVEGALSHLNDPEQIALLRRVVEQASTQAGQSLTTAAVQELATRLGAVDAGPLVARITALTEQAGAAGARGMVRVLAPGCGADDRACLDRRVLDLSRQAGAGFMAGVRSEVRLAALVLAFLVGVVCAVAVVLALQALRVLRRSQRAGLEVSRAPAPQPQPT
jgi:hypothetical protein